MSNNNLLMFLQVGKRIAELSEKKKIIPSELARLTGRSKQLVSSDLKKDSLKIDVIYKYCEALNVSLAEFFKIDVEKRDEETMVPQKKFMELLNQLEKRNKELEELKTKYIKTLEENAELRRNLNA